MEINNFSRTDIMSVRVTICLTIYILSVIIIIDKCVKYEKMTDNIET